MKFISAHVRPEKVFHGYDDNKQLVTKPMANTEFVEKVIRVDRILSFTENYIFIECPHGTAQTWEYEGSLESIKTQLRGAGMLLG
ncbi:hypothetical protein [Microvirga brassicacearum]|uniref:Uncharacterized protein n=1 Tax=Microvirga brassicacearum TaxID=2580413 RepID=A0A5N3PE59_9HYPH|nr:hypothetical protein [Microvirga brassicacearum]KAB0268037.1 hypothetical protein FEZ63_06625 [Microvirga brassicacearum]